MDATTVAINAAYVAYVLASLVPGGLRLRLALVFQSLIFITWGLLADNISAVLWNVAFATVNSLQALRIARHERVVLTDDMAAIRRSAFPSMSRRDFLILWTAGESGTASAGTQLCERGEQLDRLLLVTSGDLDVVPDPGNERRRTAPTFVGELSFLSSETASADVVAASSIAFRSWSFADLRALESAHVGVARALAQTMAHDLAEKLRT